MVLLIFTNLERGSEVLLISLDVAGAFDRVWHAGLLKKLRAAGLKGKALTLMKDYLHKRFIRVVVDGISSSNKRIFSSVPQGGRWSAPLWDFDIATLEDLDLTGILMSYADDCSLVYEVNDSNRASMISSVNQDLEKLESWGITWHVSFEPTKTHSIVISRKAAIVRFNSSGIRFMSEPVEAVEEMKLVGFIFDLGMTLKPMIDHVARKARVKLAAIRRLQQHLDSNNLEAMYKAFVRSTIEYGNLEYMSAGDTHTNRLDKIQTAAEKLGGFKVESLRSRREASLIGFVFKLLDGDGRGLLNEFIPIVQEHPHRSSKIPIGSIRVKERIKFEDTTKQYDRSIEGQILTV